MPCGNLGRESPDEHVSQTRLDAGRERCFLFTDLANPTSNKIYRALGYEPRGDVDRWAFDGPAGAAPGT